MSDRTIEQRYRTFLLWTSTAVLGGTAVELLFTEHMESFVQLIPYGLAAVGVAALLAVIHRPTAGRLRVLRVVAGVLVLGALYGIYEHFWSNLAFEMEIRPSTTRSDALAAALRGVSPLLAPGILALAGILAGAATYRHPALGPKS